MNRDVPLYAAEAEGLAQLERERQHLAQAQESLAGRQNAALSGILERAGIGEGVVRDVRWGTAPVLVVEVPDPPPVAEVAAAETPDHEAPG